MTKCVLPDDLSREVYCILGMPIDAIEMATVVGRIKSAVAAKARFLFSTANLNFLVTSLSDAEFRESLLSSDLVTLDGMPIVWIGWMLGIPFKARVAGSDIFVALKAQIDSAKPLKVFLFGGPEGIAEAACSALNAELGGLRCVGSFQPGFGSIEEMSTDEVIKYINSANADFLVVSLGAQKGQKWLLRNHDGLEIPVRSHLGAVMNFQAGVLRRCPRVMQRFGLEWAWRIKEEPHLWERYWHDARVLLRLLIFHVAPLAIHRIRLLLQHQRYGRDLVIEQVRCDQIVIVRLQGAAIGANLPGACGTFRDIIATNKNVCIDFSNTRSVDARFFGFLLMLRKTLKERGSTLRCVGLSAGLKTSFHRNGLGYLLPT
jgi:N-acetylglucosaminyldiphosphoundecaprenol N-acetyl-beta-D-mannosaminyltransferase